MPEKFFIKFPKIPYNNTTCVDITKRVLIDSDITVNPSVYHKYTIKTGARPDVIANNYYTDPEYSSGGSGSNGVGLNDIGQTPPVRYFGGTLSVKL